MTSALPVLPPIVALLGTIAVSVAGDRRVALPVVAGVLQASLLVVGALLLFRTAADGILVHALGSWRAPYGIVFVADPLAVFLLVTLLAVFTAALVYFFLDHETASRSRVLALFFLLEAGIAGALLTGDIFDFYVFFELVGLASYGLVAYRRGEAHLEAALKYAALSLGGSTLMLLGIGAIYAQTGRLAFASFYESSLHVASPPLYLFAIVLVLTSLALKAALIPLHFWLPDAHASAPTAVSVLLSGAVVKIGAYGIVRLLGVQAPWVGEEVGGVLLAVGAITAVLAALMAAAQRDLKRLLAYSTASQMGYVVAAAALGTATGVAAALLHIAAHAVMKSTLFVVAGTAAAATGTRRWDRMGGLLRSSPALATAALVALLSLAGIPPLAGFGGKLAIFGALLEARAWAPLAALIVASMVMLLLAVRIWLAVFGGEPVTGHERPRPGKVALASAMAAAVLLLGIGAGPVLGLAREAAASLLSGEAYRAAVLGAGGTEVARR